MHFHVKYTLMMLLRILLAFLFFSGGYATDEKKQIFFIVNPISHEIKGLNLENLIQKNLDLSKFEYTIAYTQSVGHATELAQKAREREIDIVAAVGGDGTVNEIGKALIHAETAMAIIPVGSGNGLARHLGIPVGFVEGVKALNKAHVTSIDVAKINDQPFLGVAGVGFDAHIAHKFDQYGKRGFFSYCRLVLQEFSRYTPTKYKMTLDGKPFAAQAFILSFANSSQYGNNFIVAPKAKLNDGQLEMVIIDKVSLLNAVPLLYRFQNGSLDHSTHFRSFLFKELILEQPEIIAHLDGEPRIFHERIKITLETKSLKIFTAYDSNS